MTNEAGVVSIDADGRVIDAAPDDVSLPSLLVAPVSDAVKKMEGDRLTEDLDRSQLWSVRGIAVDRLVMESVPDGSFTMAELIQQVESAGQVWSTTPL